MKFYNYLSDKIMFILLNIILCFILSCFLLSIGNSFTEILLIIIGWLLVLFCFFVFDYYKIKSKYSELMEIMNKLDHKYLMSEMLKEPDKKSELIYYDIIKQASKSMNDEIARIKRLQKDYQEYIEEWVHEIKTPIAASLLLCENSDFPKKKEMNLELEKINNLVSQTLFYARSEVIEKDYFIKELNLEDIIHNNIVKYRDNLNSNNISIMVDGIDKKIYTDEKWLDFILDQIIVNAIKYSKEKGCIKISAKENHEGVTLSIYDEGVGIKNSDLPRIFEKGFTGSNRSEKRSTGIGLYLAKKLCSKLGHDIKAESADGEYTNIIIFFPKGKLNKFE